MKIQILCKNIYFYIKFLIEILLILLLKILRRFNKKYFKPKTLVLVRLDAIGDFIMWLQSAKYYRLLYPNYNIILFCNSLYKDLALNCNLFDKVFAIDVSLLNSFTPKKFKYLYNIDKSYYEILICDMYSRVFATSETISFLLNAKTKFAVQGDLANINKLQKIISNKMYDEIVVTKTKKFEINKNFEFIKIYSKYKLNPKFDPIDSLFNIKFTNQYDFPYILINLGAGITYRQWPIENFVELINKLSLMQYTIIIVGSNNDIHYSNKFITQINNLNIINLTGKTNLIELLILIKFAKIVIGNESSCAHIAAALNVPSLVILGGGHFGRFMPYDIKNISTQYNFPIVVYNKMDCFNCNWNCIYPLYNNQTWECINNVKVSDVLKLIPKL